MRGLARPGGRLVLDALAGTLAFGAVGGALVTAISTADRGIGGALASIEVLVLIGPLAAAVAVAVAVARSRASGRWDGWSALGVSPLQQLAPLAFVALLGATVQLSVPPPADVSATMEALSAPAPVDARARWWPDGAGGWDTPDLSGWQSRPATLSTRALWERFGRDAPRGARIGVDRGELVRRGGLVLAWPAGVLLGVGAALACSRRERGGGTPAIRASAWATAGAAAWLLAVLSAAAYASVGM